MRAYGALFRIRFVNSLQYRVAAFAAIFTNFAWGFMYLLAFSAFYAENPAAFPMTWEQTVAYVWLQQSFLMLFYVWFWEQSIVETLEKGDIAYELVRPMNLYSRWVCIIMASRLSRCLLRAVPVLVVAFFLPLRFRLVFVADFWVLALFIISLALSLGVMAVFSMIVYISAFYTINGNGIRIIVAVASDFFSGGLVPVPFFPDALRTAIEFSPFGSMQNTPLLIFGGYFSSGAEIAQALGLQVFWLVALYAVGRAFMARSLRRVVVQGG